MNIHPNRAYSGSYSLCESHMNTIFQGLLSDANRKMKLTISRAADIDLSSHTYCGRMHFLNETKKNSV